MSYPSSGTRLLGSRPESTVWTLAVFHNRYRSTVSKGRTLRCRMQSTPQSGSAERKRYRYWGLRVYCRWRVAPRPQRAGLRWRTCRRKRPRPLTKLFSARKSFQTLACRPSMSSTRRAQSLKLSNRSLGGAAAAVAGAAVAGAAVAAGAVAAVAAAAVVAAARHGDVAASAKGHTTARISGATKAPASIARLARALLC